MIKDILMGHANITIRQDSEGRYGLNDIQKASEGSALVKDIRPNEWLSSSSTKGLIATLIAENSAFEPMTRKRGNGGGTYVVKELVYAYAMWISPSSTLKSGQGRTEVLHRVRAAGEGVGRYPILGLAQLNSKWRLGPQA